MRENSEKRLAFHVSKAVGLSALLVNWGCLLKSHWEAIILVPTVLLMWGKIQPFLLLWGKRWVASCCGSHRMGNLLGGQAQSHGTDLDIWCYISSFHSASEHLRKHLTYFRCFHPCVCFWHREKNLLGTWGIWDAVRNQGFIRMAQGKSFSHTQMKWLLPRIYELVGAPIYSFQSAG